VKVVAVIISYVVVCVRVGTKLNDDASSSKSQGTSHSMEDGVSSNSCTMSLFVRKMGIKRDFAIGMPNACAKLILLGL
jgi:hypothetical protein